MKTVVVQTDGYESIEIPLVNKHEGGMLAVWEESQPDAPRPRYRAGIVLPMCDHKHRSLRAAVTCAARTSLHFEERLRETREAHEARRRAPA